LTRPWLLLVAACAIVVVAVGLAVSSAQRPPSPGRAAALTSTDPADGAALERAPSGVELSFTAAPDPGLSHVSVRDGSGTAKADAAGNAAVAAGSAHQHGVDPVSAALLAIDGIVALAVIVLLLRRPPPQPSGPPS
jgi:methionine-rich copper-binding protein CopC